MWFKKLTGFDEETPEQVRKNISIKGNKLFSHVNGKEFTFGCLETPTLSELRKRVSELKISKKKISLSEIIADTQKLHIDQSNTDALFQVASQFNLLEMVSPNITPEYGISDYEFDRTQGPASAIAAGAGAIYRNYFINVNGQIGQSSKNQIDCLSDIGNYLGNSNNDLWLMRNGYTLATKNNLIKITNKITSLDPIEFDKLKQLLRIGLQWNTEVTLSRSRHTVSQAYCSALPVAYSENSSKLWSVFANLILEASYEAVICAGILNYHNTGNNSVYLTLIGGGAFGNEIEWILNAIKHSIDLYKNSGLDIKIVSYGHSNYDVQQLITNFTNE